MELAKLVLRQIGLAALMLAALAGFAVSAYVHTHASFGRLPLGEASMNVHVWAIIVMAITVIVANRATKDDRRQVDFSWLMRGAPRVVRWLTPVFFVYFVVNFANLAMTEQSVGRGKAPLVEVARMFSSGWMLIFVSAFALAWSQLGLAGERRRRCPNGHLVGDADGYCASCGANIVEPTS